MGKMGQSHHSYEVMPEAAQYRNKIGMRVPSLEIWENKNPDHDLNPMPTTVTSAKVLTSHITPKCPIFDKLERVRTEITYRCKDWRKHPGCKNNRFENTSIQEEVDQTAICVNVDNNQKIGKKPLLSNPVHKSIPINGVASNQSQIGKKPLYLNHAHESKLGLVDIVHNLCDKSRDMIQINEVKDFIPWRGAWKRNSISMPCRLI